MKTIFSRFYGGVAYKPFSWIEWCLASIFALNSLYHIFSYSIATLSIQPVVLSPRQRKLLGIPEDDPFFKTEVSTVSKSLEPSSPINFTCMNLSRHSSTLGSPVLNDSSKLK